MSWLTWGIVAATVAACLWRADRRAQEPPTRPAPPVGHAHRFPHDRLDRDVRCRCLACEFKRLMAREDL